MFDPEFIGMLLLGVFLGLVGGAMIAFPHWACIWVALAKSPGSGRWTVFVASTWVMATFGAVLAGWDGIWRIMLFMSAPTLALLVWRFFMYGSVQFTLSAIFAATLVLAVFLGVLRAVPKAGPIDWSDNKAFLLFCGSSAFMAVAGAWAASSVTQRMAILPLAGMAVAFAFWALIVPDLRLDLIENLLVFLYTSVPATSYGLCMMAFTYSALPDLVMSGPIHAGNIAKAMVVGARPTADDWVAMEQKLAAEGDSADKKSTGETLDARSEAEADSQASWKC